VQFCSENCVDSSLSRVVTIVKTHNSDYNAPKWRFRSFKVINFCYNRKPLYNFLLVINCHLCSISHRFWDIALQKRKPPHPSLSPRSRRYPLILFSNLPFQQLRPLVVLQWKPRDPVCSYFVTIHSRPRRQTTSHHNSRTRSDKNQRKITKASDEQGTIIQRNCLSLRKSEKT